MTAGVHSYYIIHVLISTEYSETGSIRIQTREITLVFDLNMLIMHSVDPFLLTHILKNKEGNKYQQYND